MGFFPFVGGDRRDDRDWEYQSRWDEHVIVARKIHDNIGFWTFTLHASKFVTSVLRTGVILQYVTQTQVSVVIGGEYFSPFQGPII